MRYGLRLLVALVMVLPTFGVDRVAVAQSAPEAFTLQLGGTATVRFESFCLDFGKKFPDAIGLPPTGTADPAVREALRYAQSKGYIDSDAKEVQFAIWKARGAEGSPEPGDVGREIAANASGEPTLPAGATSIVDAIQNNEIRVDAGSWQPIGEKLTIGNFNDYFRGRGELKIENTSGQVLTLYMPVGTTFPAPAEEFQSMAGIRRTSKSTIRRSRRCRTPG